MVTEPGESWIGSGTSIVTSPLIRSPAANVRFVGVMLAETPLAWTSNVNSLDVGAVFSSRNRDVSVAPGASSTHWATCWPRLLMRTLS